MRFGNTSEAKIRKNLRASAADGAAFGGMVGIGETYLAAFALAVGMSELTAGMVASLPMLAGGVMQLLSLRAVRWFGSEQRWILFGASIQACAFLPLVYAALQGEISSARLLLVASIYWGAGLATGPAWNVWIENLVPSRVRTRYFAVRSRLAQLTTLGGFLIGGALLAWGQSIGQVLWAFSIMFLSASLLRFWSVYWLSRHQPIERPDHPPASSMGATSTEPIPLVRVHGGLLLVFLAVLQGMVQVSGPFFTPFMLKELQFSYPQFVGLISLSFVAKSISLAYWASFAKRFGVKSLLWIGAVGLVPLSACWIVSQSYAWLMFAQVLSGVLWAAYELGFFLMFFEAIPKHRRIMMLTVYNFANTLAIFAGAAIGGWLLTMTGTTRESYYLLFGVSSVGRLLALGILASATLRPVPVIQLGIRVLSLRVGAGSLDAPVLASLDEGQDEADGLVSAESAA
ncbi:MFS transporter [Roseiconus lacunae]|uniref:MFS transporter n=1 Tax=Roseiconus lacunae TaxID=2605694 RepID=UPI0013D9A29A